MREFLLHNIASVATPLLIAFYILSIRKLIKDKSTEGVSMAGWVLLNASLLCMFINALTLYFEYGTYGFLITETANVGLAMIELALIIKYRKKVVK